MSFQPRPGTVALLQALSRAGGAIVVTIGLLVFAGFAFGISSLTVSPTGGIPMMPNTALGFVLSGSSLIVLASPRAGRRARRGGRIAALAVGLLGAATLCEYALGVNLGVDEALFSDPRGPSDSFAPGRMAVATALCFSLLGAALWFLDIPRAHVAGHICLFLAGVVSMVHVAGYIYGVDAFHRFHTSTQMALHTSIAFVVLCASLLLAHPDRGIAAILFSTSAGGVVARRILPIALFVPLLFGWLRLEGERAGLYETSFGVALFALSNVFVLSVAICWIAASLHRTDIERDRAEGQFRLAVESTPSAMVMINRQGRILLVNSTTEKLFGYGREEMLGQSVEMLVPERLRPAHPSYRDGFFANPQSRPMGMGRDLLARRKDGSEFPVEIGLNPSESAEGTLVLAAVVDISERKRAEERFRRALESAPSAMVMIDRDGKIVLVNSMTEKLFGYPRDEMLGQPVEMLVPERFRAKHPEYRTSFFADPVARPMGGERDLLGRRKDGSEFPVEIGLNPIQSAEGTFVLSAVVDISERKRSEESIRQAHEELEARVEARTTELAAANKELEAFSYSVSHDLRAPLRAIDGFSRILLAEFGQGLPAQAREYLQDVRANAQKMGRLVDDLLAFSRLSRQPLKKQPVRVDRLVDQCLQELSAEQAGRKVDVRVGGLPECDGDPSLLKQVWTNLLSNALKYTNKRESAVIEVGGHNGGSNSERTYFVKDNGVGFDMRYAHKLFGVFQRLHRSEDYDGTGVGLAIVQRIIHRHGGRIWAEAQPDHGATFYFTMNCKRDRS
jgi:PAS domain S-box-containing protein